MAYQSAFRPALFVLDEVNAPAGLDVAILPAAGNESLGVKRIRGEGEFAVNVAPYVRAQLSPVPLCDKSMGMFVDQGRCAGCRVEADEITSDVVFLTGGQQDAPMCEILSAAPSTLTIRSGEKDEISVITGGGEVTSLLTFSHEGSEYTCDMFLPISGSGMLTFVVDQTAVALLFAETTGATPTQMGEFGVVLSDGEVDWCRHYIVDTAPHRGKQLAWVNRYGAVDYYTFPDIASRTLSGGRGRILSSAGWNTVATETTEWTLLTSQYEQSETLEWLAEIFSSPRVWMIEGNVATEVDVADGEVSFDPTLPRNMTVKVRPAAVTPSRKL